MIIGNPDDLPQDGKNPELSFEALMRAANKKLENIPSEMKMPSMPPSESEAEEAKQYIKKHLKLPITESPCTKIFVANEIIDRSNIREGRIGEWEDRSVFLFLYKLGGTLKTIQLTPRDGLDARFLAKAVLWGYIADLPSDLAHSEILGMERFFNVKTINLTKLADLNVLEKFKKEYSASVIQDFERERISRILSENYSIDLKNQIDALQQKLELLQGNLAKALNFTLFWKIVAIICLVVAIISIFCFMIPSLLK